MPVNTPYRSRIVAVSVTAKRTHPFIRIKRCGVDGFAAFSCSFIHQVAHSCGSATPNVYSIRTTNIRLIGLPLSDNVKTRYDCHFGCDILLLHMLLLFFTRKKHYISMYSRTHPRKRALTHSLIHARTHVCVHVCMFCYLNVHALCACMPACLCACLCVISSIAF